MFLFVVNSLVAITSQINLFGPIHTGLWRVLVFVITLPVLLIGIKINNTTRLIFILLIYLFIVLFNNTYFIPSFSIYIGVVFSLFMYPIAYSYIRNISQYNELYYIIIIILLIFGIHFLAAQFFQYGPSPYLQGGVYLGGGGVHQTYIIVYFLLFLPFLLLVRNKKPQNIHILVFILSIIPVFLIFRRGSLLGMISGFLIYIILTPRKSKWLKFISIISILLVILSPLYFQRFVDIIEHRFIKPTEFAEVGRTAEIIEFIPYWINEKGFLHALFGSELYDYRTLASVTRELHTDFATYFIGAGIVGFILYFSVIGMIWVEYYRNSYRIPDMFVRREIRAILASLTVAYLLISYSGQFYVVSSLSAVMMFFAIINRYTRDVAQNVERRNERTTRVT